MQQLNGKSCNPVNNYARNNNRPLVVTHCNTEEHKNSFFLRTAVDWNRLENNVVHVKVPSHGTEFVSTHTQII